MQTENVREENQIVQVRVSQLRTFKKHPFKVRDDEKMQKLVDSIRERGIVTPVAVVGAKFQSISKLAIDQLKCIARIS